MDHELVLCLISTMMLLPLAFHPLCSLKPKGHKARTLRPHNIRIAESEWSLPSPLPSPPKPTSSLHTSEGATERLAICSTQSGSANDPTLSHATNTEITDNTLKAKIDRIRNSSKFSNKNMPQTKFEKTQKSIEDGAFRQDKTQIASKEPIIEPGKATDGQDEAKQNIIKVGKTQIVHDGNREKRQSTSVTDESQGKSRTSCSEEYPEKAPDDKGTRDAHKNEKKRRSAEKVVEMPAKPSKRQDQVAKRIRRARTMGTQDEFVENFHSTQCTAEDNYVKEAVKEGKPITKSKS